MNMPIYIKLIQTAVVGGLLIITSCLSPDPVSELDYVAVQDHSRQKREFMSDRDFVSLAYSDLFCHQITSAELDKLLQTYKEVSDKSLVRDMVVRDFLRSKFLILPGAQDIRTDKDKFITDTYRKFYRRDPTKLERWTMFDQISKDTNCNAVLIYYSFLSSEEYLNY